MSKNNTPQTDKIVIVHVKQYLIGRTTLLLNPIVLGKAKIAYNFGLSECNRVKIKPLKGQAKLQQMTLLFFLLLSLEENKA